MAITLFPNQRLSYLVHKMHGNTHYNLSKLNHNYKVTQENINLLDQLAIDGIFDGLQSIIDLPKSTTKGLKLTAVRLKGKAKLRVVVSLI
ncbi:MAG: hypothetical protein Q8835_03195, partial [Sweet potato little leaf phytoplasma]|nr:hypothetical protein [Sweet potato little leaf phytoplasma]